MHPRSCSMGSPDGNSNAEIQTRFSEYIESPCETGFVAMHARERRPVKETMINLPGTKGATASSIAILMYGRRDAASINGRARRLGSLSESP